MGIRVKLQKHRKVIVFILDSLIVLAVSIALFYIIQNWNEKSKNDFILLFPHFVLLIICGTVSQFCFKTYDSIWRYAESREYLMLILGGMTGYISFLFLDHYMLKGGIPILYSLATYSISLIGMLFMRLTYRQYRKRNKDKNRKGRIPLVIIGAGEAGVKLQEEVTNNPNSSYDTVCYIDDSIEKIGKYIHNIEVKGPIKDLEKLLRDRTVSEIVVAMPSISPERLRLIIKICRGIKCRIRILPDMLTLLQNNNQNNLWKQVRDVDIEELLGREQVTFDNDEVKELLHNKVVMVTGGGGSIGSEICRQIATVHPKRLIIVDNYENNAYDIQQELFQTYGTGLDVKIEIATIREKDKVDQLFDRNRPNVVFHAAAHKHVPLMEECPEEAIKNNIIGTYHVVQAADRFKVDKFVQISTDKAVNPTSVMGASKRFCEMILQSMKNDSKTEFVAVRFGNVLGSNGSVIPLFKKQIAQGGPVTITDKRIVRYFMTISEAAQLVLQAGSMANSTEIYVLDMGQPVKVLELAENLIRLSGHVPYTDIPIIETGLRPGEKLYEELLMQSEELITTSNHKIYIEKQKGISKSQLDEKLNILYRSLETGSPTHMKEAMKLVVPTYHNQDEVNRESMDLDYSAILTKDRS